MKRKIKIEITPCLTNDIREVAFLINHLIEILDAAKSRYFTETSNEEKDAIRRSKNSLILSMGILAAHDFKGMNRK